MGRWPPGTAVPFGTRATQLERRPAGQRPSRPVSRSSFLAPRRDSAAIRPHGRTPTRRCQAPCAGRGPPPPRAALPPSAQRQEQGGRPTTGGATRPEAFTSQRWAAEPSEGLLASCAGGGALLPRPQPCVETPATSPSARTGASPAALVVLQVAFGNGQEGACQGSAANATAKRHKLSGSSAAITATSSAARRRRRGGPRQRLLPAWMVPWTARDYDTCGEERAPYSRRLR